MIDPARSATSTGRTFLHSNRLSSCCRRGKYPHSTEPVPAHILGTGCEFCKLAQPIVASGGNGFGSWHQHAANEAIAQEAHGHNTLQPRPCPSHDPPRGFTHFSDAPLGYAGAGAHLEPCEMFLRYLKLATSSLLNMHSTVWQAASHASRDTRPPGGSRRALNSCSNGRMSCGRSQAA